MDIIKEQQAKEQYDQIRSFVQGTVADKAPIIPISAQLKYNVDVSFVLLSLISLFRFYGICSAHLFTVYMMFTFFPCIVLE